MRAPHELGSCFAPLQPHVGRHAGLLERADVSSDRILPPFTATILGAGPMVYDESWASRMGLAIADHGKHRTVDEMVGQRIDDYGASKEYMGLVFDKTEAWLASLDPSTLTEIVVARPFPPQIASTYSARVAGEAGITWLDATECRIYQHGLRHMGEIEHARALVGLEGMTS
jgi:hypothetical protein